MNGIVCMLNKKCREEKSKEIVKNINNEQQSYEDIYAKTLNK